MKVGMLIECGRQGLEDVVCRRIFALLRDFTGVDFEFDIVPMDNKGNLIRNCGSAASALIAKGCNHVVILWDEHPAWPKKGERLCWRNDRQDILAGLARNQIDHNLISLVCIERAFESWLLYDERMLSCVFSTDAHHVRVGPQSRPDKIKDPKGAMTSLFRKNRGWRYVDIQFAEKFASCLQDLVRLKKCKTFRRFAEKITGRTL